MDAFSYVVLILLSLVGYSAGAVSKAGKRVLKPQIIDLVLIIAIWSAAISSRLMLDLNKWLLILIWIILSFLIGIIAVWPRKFSKEKASSHKVTVAKESSANLVKKLWRSWGNFSLRMGNFQSGIVLSLFFFIVVSPFALAVKMFSDPLRIRYRGNQSHWLPKIKTKVDLEQFRRQF